MGDGGAAGGEGAGLEVAQVDAGQAGHGAGDDADSGACGDEVGGEVGVVGVTGVPDVDEGVHLSVRDNKKILSAPDRRCQIFDAVVDIFLYFGELLAGSMDENQGWYGGAFDSHRMTVRLFNKGRLFWQKSFETMARQELFGFEFIAVCRHYIPVCVGVPYGRIDYQIFGEGIVQEPSVFDNRLKFNEERKNFQDSGASGVRNDL